MAFPAHHHRGSAFAVPLAVALVHAKGCMDDPTRQAFTGVASLPGPSLHARVGLRDLDYRVPDFHSHPQFKPDRTPVFDEAREVLARQGRMAVTLSTTHGDLKLELFCQACPKTTYNFLALCASGAYNASPFHRSVPGFMIQGGSPASGSTKDSPSIYGSNFEDEIKSSLRHHGRGIVSMANKGKNTNGSQFYVTYAAAPHLDGVNTVFGRVLEGWETLDRMEGVEVDRKNRPSEGIRIEGVKIHANPLADER
ncbi:Peptidyl-prolyl cis-trans isomerase cyp10 [Teratosphaeriaceae sp. CCFEE 6253]|nr:Peptidyl-prolyl cis-trans isomerase cyp10 [Teratosphaeriaceae sp. CCFEE 6253]